ncbi:SRPBCC family protein [Streptomyces sp. SAJ15]|uniref:SRPBCC family protein n=1 Tax=Streptomyces sp. SAJ15 TaxID=2011095 RepID=UPI001187026D|nr:SRPBCC family protein [Streptomyces sp. SAJ15]TVL93336.1 MxaD family protein [Streptomyces sp. SAJ15]
MTRRLRSVGLDFADAAPLRLAFTADSAAPPGAVFDVLADVAGWPAWFSAVSRARPFDIGGRPHREVLLRGGVRFVETVLAADPARAYAYRVDETNAPGLRALLEVWQLTPTGPTPAPAPTPAYESGPGGGASRGAGTRIRYVFAVDGTAALRWSVRAARPGIGASFRRAVAALTARAVSH